MAKVTERSRLLFREAQTLISAGRLPEARDKLRDLIAKAPKTAEAHFHLGRIARAQGDIDAAIRHLGTARSLKPGEPAIVEALADAFAAANRTDEAIKLYDGLISANPSAVKPRAGKALLLQRTGDFKAAEAEFRKALAAVPNDGELYRMFLATRKVEQDDPIISRMLKAHADPGVTGRSRVHLNFALAKAMEDVGETGRVFEFLRPANAAMHVAQPYDVTPRKREVEALMEAFRGACFKPVHDPSPEFSPIFVTGLPRSGTTLVEQVIASHSLVTGAGEQSFGLRFAYMLLGDPAKGLRRLANVPDEHLKGFADAYEKAMRGAVGFDRVVTDKGIQSHLIIGLLKKAIPSSRIIVVRRDPRDLLFSIYKNVFAEGTHRYAYSLTDLASYYVTFERMIDFWREACPEAFTEIRYEDLVADPEAESRHLIAASGLDWEDACLDFHERDRQVKTLSVAQVRQPIYKSSAQGWKKYEAELSPLVEALEREGVKLP